MEDITNSPYVLIHYYPEVGGSCNGGSCKECPFKEIKKP